MVTIKTLHTHTLIHISNTKASSLTALEAALILIHL